MTVDPGGRSGVAGGYFMNMGSVAATLKRAVRREAVWAVFIDGSPEEQAWWLARQWTEFRFKWVVEYGQRADRCSLVVEAFKLRQRSVELSPVEVTSGLTTLLRGSGGDWPQGEPVYQEPSSAKGYATNDRLKEWGLYPLGRGGGDHKRDALRHIAARVAAEIG